MSVGSLGGVAASAAGAPLAQAKGSEIERAQQDATAGQRVAASDQKAEAAAGVGETDGQEHEAAERDADGRLPWRVPVRRNKAGETPPQAAVPGKDATHQSGTLLDLSG